MTQSSKQRSSSLGLNPKPSQGLDSKKTITIMEMSYLANVSVDMLNELARTDPYFPPVIRSGGAGNARHYDRAALITYYRKRKIIGLDCTLAKPFITKPLSALAELLTG